MYLYNMLHRLNNGDLLTFGIINSDDLDLNLELGFDLDSEEDDDDEEEEE